MSEEVRSISSTGGEKGVKIERYDLIPEYPLKMLAILYGKGIEKYAPRNWELGFEWSKSFASLQRHSHAFWDGEDIDSDMNSPHLAAVAWYAFALLEFTRRHPNFDDRPFKIDID